MRGGPVNNDDDIDEDPGRYRNGMLSFGCPPGSGVDASSTIAVEYFR